ncbi:nuclear receptor interaction protein-like protein [Leptotrombidium deliense]|uniref:Nuclear receptor interaction protein-like protein n=1 Tax=Leptotrombidium deliense TaxID=299467 RepID=A0A443SEI0_9ACAR|nr:nuclear receptor interaction protein-like protein [Leptotrombidium deliense]
MTKKSNLFYAVYNNEYNHKSTFPLYDAAKNSKSFVQRLCLQAALPVHKGCVNTISWNESGQWLLSGSDDQHLCITHAYTHKKLVSIRTGHRANIFSARFLPNTNDRLVVSCSGDGMIVYTEIERPETSLCNIFNCHYGTAYEVTTVPNDPHTFLSCGEDGTVRWFDLRMKNRCSVNECKDDILIKCRDAVTALAVNRLVPYLLGVGCADSNVRIYDRRMLGTKALGSLAGNSVQSVITRFIVPELESKSHRITSLTYSPDGEEMLVSYSSDFVYLFNTKDDGKSKATVLEKPISNKSNKKPLVRRLRVRGDWSDTGPNARPEAERASPAVASNNESDSGNDSELSNSTEQQRSRPLHSYLMQRMSDVLNRIFHASSRRRSRTSEASTEENEQQPSEEVQAEENINGTEPKTESSTAHNSHSVNSTVEEVNESQQASELNSHRDEEELNNLDIHSREPVVNLQYSGQGLNSGIITVESTEAAGVSSEMVGSSVMYLREENTTNELPAERSSNSPLLPENSAATNESDALVMEIQEWDDYEDGSEDREVESRFDGRRSRRSLRIDDEQSTDSENRSSNDVSGSGRKRNPRDLLIRSFDDVLKHFREQKEQEKAQFARIAIPSVKQRYSGHRNARTMIKESTFWGNNYVMSGSDCGHIFIWDRFTAELVMMMEADKHVVNCLQPHPFDPILASSGIDSDIKIWAPLHNEPFFDEDKANEVVRNNEIMLEETKDTITVPASFMIRMLSSLNQLRTSRSSRNRQSNETLRSDDSSSDDSS